MPLYYFRCDACPLEGRRLLTPDQARGQVPCPKCAQAMIRTPRPPTSTTMEVLDNGWMVRRLERPADVERLVRERARASQEE